jgi:magnesium and cobalt transporter
MVTIEDVLEQIVGDISDEYDFDEDEDNIIRQDDAHWRVKADTEIEDFNEAMGTDFSDEDYDTIGGLILKAAGQLPKRNERVQIGEWQFTVLRADSRRLHSVLAERTLIDEGKQVRI